MAELHLGNRSGGEGALLVKGVLVSVGLIAARHTLHQTASMGEQMIVLLLSPSGLGSHMLSRAKHCKCSTSVD